jgi:hypothetical protein
MNPPVRLMILCWLLGVLCAGSTTKSAVVRPPGRELFTVERAFANTLAREARQTHGMSSSSPNQDLCD